ncbi:MULTISPECIES: EF-hand domain-containing protein [Streptomyces]|uniref:EF-hand domain-containing protein n=1 Tax=Streptomyces TaxID=1883 RepID=UPI0007878463|nr:MULTISPECIES: EF-hand domain-containing protein [unclassified Streptomyces]AVH99335.1 calcium-binding protein [Streptomyces sp. WAC00288]KYG50768.1 calcium-binding protein [Streptomyces sp. WAC04657]PVC69364.1 calcium-binding protein [Streptomyces sp. CS081A]
MTALQDLKYGQWFRGADVDGDGFITQEDVRMMSARYIDARGAAPDSATARLLTEQMDGFWTNVIAPMDQDGDGKVDLREMTEGFNGVLTDPALYPQQIAPVTDCFFDLVDLNADGKIDQAEFQQMFDSVAGVPGEDCAEIFAALDRDGSGALDRAEFHQALAEFFYGNDPDAPANHLFGRIAG